MAKMIHQVPEEPGLRRKPEIGAATPDRFAGPRQVDDHAGVIPSQVRNDLAEGEPVQGIAMDQQQRRPAADDPIGNLGILIAKVPERLLANSSRAYDHLQVPDGADDGTGHCIGPARSRSASRIAVRARRG